MPTPPSFCSPCPPLFPDTYSPSTFPLLLRRYFPHFVRTRRFPRCVFRPSVCPRVGLVFRPSSALNVRLFVRGWVLRVLEKGYVLYRRLDNSQATGERNTKIHTFLFKTASANNAKRGRSFYCD